MAFFLIHIQIKVVYFQDDIWIYVASLIVKVIQVLLLRISNSKYSNSIKSAYLYYY